MPLAVGCVQATGIEYREHRLPSILGTSLGEALTVAAPLGDRVVLDGATGQPVTREPAVR